MLTSAFFADDTVPLDQRLALAPSLVSNGRSVIDAALDDLPIAETVARLVSPDLDVCEGAAWVLARGLSLRTQCLEALATLSELEALATLERLVRALLPQRRGLHSGHATQRALARTLLALDLPEELRLEGLERVVDAAHHPIRAAVVEALRGADPKLRRHERSKRRLSAFLMDEASEVRWQALLWLRTDPETLASSARRSAQLRAAQDTENGSIRGEALMQLARATLGRDPELRALALGQLDDPFAGSDAFRALLWSLGPIDDDALDDVRAVLLAAPTDVRRDACRALIDATPTLTSPGVTFATLLDELRDQPGSRPLRAQLVAGGLRSLPDDERCAFVEIAIRDPHKRVRRAAVFALTRGMLRDEPRLRLSVEVALRDPDPKIQRCAKRLLETPRGDSIE